MAIEKMNLLTITGPERDLDLFIARNLLDTDVQIEDAKKFYDKAWKLEYYNNDYTIKENLKKCRELMKEFGISYREEYSNLFIENTVKQLGGKIQQIKNAYDEMKNKIEILQNEKDTNLSKIIPAEKLSDLSIDMKDLYNLKYMKFRYGKISTDRLEDIKSKIKDLNVILFEIEKKQDITWIIYLTTIEFVQNIDVFFNMQNFERIWLDSDLSRKTQRIYR